ncbi:MAG TPA: HD domain-containing phosphohydrolase [Thermoanaerobaculia bacterium]|nr:HD domain-containing phosphohydrolase [Thermoanaerobaculia bacterium]
MRAVELFPRLRIVTALVAALLVVSILPLVGLHFSLIGINREALETSEKKYLKGSSVTLADRIERYLANSQKDVARVADGIRLGREIATTSGADIDPFFSLGKTRFLDETLESLSGSGIRLLRVVDLDGVGATAPPGPVDPELEQKLTQALNVAVKGQTWRSAEPVYPKSHPDGGLIVAAPVGSRGEETLGAVLAFVSLEPLKKHFVTEGQESAAAGAGVLAYVVDRKGHLLFSSDPSAFPSNDLSKIDLVREFMVQPVRVTKSYSRGEGKGARRVLGTLATVPSPTDWGVIVETEEKSAFAAVAQMAQISTSAALLALVLVGVVALLVARLLSRPVLDLVEKVRSVADGHFKQRVPVRGVYELAQLSATFNSMSDSIEKSVEKLRLAARENQELFINSIRTLAAAIDAKDPYTRGHSERVARYAVVIARHMDMTPEEIRTVRLAALLHDVGKIGIDDRILRKPTALTSEEFEVMKSHPVKGAIIMGQIPQLKDVVPGIRNHHEKWAGGGYPDGLKEAEIPRIARIVAVADTFDAMTTTRPYQKAMPLPYVIERIQGFAGRSFDPAVTGALEKAFAGGDLEFLGEEVSMKVSA